MSSPTTTPGCTSTVLTVGVLRKKTNKKQIFGSTTLTMPEILTWRVIESSTKGNIMRGDISVSVTIGVTDTYFAVSNTHQMMAVHKYAPGLDHTIMLGRATKTHIDRLIDCLERLKVHAVPE
jgi:hypothetical protein